MAQPPVDQAVADVDGVDARRAAFEQDLRKATCRCADVEANAALRR